MAKSIQKKIFRTKLTQIGLGLVMVAGAVWAVTQPENALGTFLTILGLALLLRGAAGIASFYQLNNNLTIKDKIDLGIGVLLVCIGILMLAMPGLMAPILKWIAAAAFALTAAKGLIALHGWRGRNRSLAKLSLSLNLALLIAAVFLVFNPLPSVLTLPFLLFICLMCAGTDLIANGIIRKG